MSTKSENLLNSLVPMEVHQWVKSLGQSTRDVLDVQLIGLTEVIIQANIASFSKQDVIIPSHIIEFLNNIIQRNVFNQITVKAKDDTQMIITQR